MSNATIYHDEEAARLEEEADRIAQELKSLRIPEDRTLLFVSLLIAATLAAAFIYFWFIGQHELPSQSYSEDMTTRDRFELRGLFGDQWGAFTGVMSGLTLAFVALSLFAQRSELRMSRRELSMQGLELKYARAQSHRQISELIKQREEEERRGRYQKEPVVLAGRVKLVPKQGGIEIELGLDHTGPTACNLTVQAQFAGAESFSIKAPQVQASSSIVVYAVPAPELQSLKGLTEGKSHLLLNLALRYLNLAGGEFLCKQTFRMAAFSLKSAISGRENEPSEFEVVSTSFQQGG